MTTRREQMIEVQPDAVTALTLTVVAIGEDARGQYVTMRWEEQQQQRDMRVGEAIELNLYGEQASS